MSSDGYSTRSKNPKTKRPKGRARSRREAIKERTRTIRRSRRLALQRRRESKRGSRDSTVGEVLLMIPRKHRRDTLKNDTAEQLALAAAELEDQQATRKHQRKTAKPRKSKQRAEATSHRSTARADHRKPEPCRCVHPTRGGARGSRTPVKRTAPAAPSVG